ncbi:unnamed protein product [Caenorhabditis sp. 36 PRJEB53466]|nr:unnamed protein product [Caenorhabditis sp. 36 PRJEB53466]
MSDFKKYPEEAAQVRELIEHRRHFLNVIFAMAVIATYQICLSSGWYAYLSEAYYHLADNTEHFVHMVELFGQFLAICLLYIAIYVRRNALTVFLIIFYFGAASLKLLQISTFYPDPGFRGNSQLSRDTPSTTRWD